MIVLLIPVLFVDCSDRRQLWLHNTTPFEHCFFILATFCDQNFEEQGQSEIEGIKISNLADLYYCIPAAPGGNGLDQQFTDPIPVG